MSEPHAVPDVSPQLRALLDSLRQGGSPTAIVRQWQSGLRSADVNEVLRRAALTRRFDETLFPTLQVNLQAPPAFDEFVSLPEVRKLMGQRHEGALSELEASLA